MRRPRSIEKLLDELISTKLVMKGVE